ncbi:acetyltransferase [Nitrospira sp.]|nr:acetyltransferase [Nitrospira sp.]
MFRAHVLANNSLQRLVFREAVVALFGRSVRQIAGRDYDDRQIAVWAPEYPDMDAWADRLGSGTVLVAEVRESMAGFARLDKEGNIDLLYVDSTYERCGVATRLINGLTRVARGRGLRRLYADVSVTARPFFEAQGIEVLESQSVERRGVVLRNYRMVRAEHDGV